LRQGDNSGLIALSGGPLGDIGQLLAAGKLDQADVRAQAWAQVFPGSYYIEVQRPGGRDGAAANEVLVAASVDLAARLGLPLVATHPVQFLQKDDFKAHEARVCIADGYVLGDTRRPKRYSPEQYFKTRAEMVELFADLPEALQQLGGNRPPLQPERGTGQEPPAGFPDARPASRWKPFLPASRMRASCVVCNCCIPMWRNARSSGRPMSRGSISRSRPSSRWASPATS
jgi:DNA polymerase-3 subunit alpha